MTFEKKKQKVNVLRLPIKNTLLTRPMQAITCFIRRHKIRDVVVKRIIISNTQYRLIVINNIHDVGGERGVNQTGKLLKT